MNAKPLGTTSVLALALAVTGSLVGCNVPEPEFEPSEPQRGPGELVGNDGPITDGVFAGGADLIPAPMDVAPPLEVVDAVCDGNCIAYCDAAGLQNPVNAGLCDSLWGVGLNTQPIDVEQTCRRLYVDMVGRFPSLEEVASVCRSQPWGDVVSQLMASEEFVELGQRRWSDSFQYDTESVSVERIYDMDELVGKLYRGEVAYDQFAAVASSHPVLTRRHATSGDRAEALYWLFMGRPPLGSERSDLARLYNVWGNGYYDHPELGMRLPDAVISFPCLTEEGEIDPLREGECTSVLWGYNQLILQPDVRATATDNGWEMWSGLLTAEEWGMLQAPGEILSSQTTFWEYAVDAVVEDYLGYNLDALVPEVRDNLVRYLLENDGDIRSVHYAVLTSAAYLQGSSGDMADAGTPFRWTYGPLNQVDPEVWIDSLERSAGVEISDCDHRLNRPDDFLDIGTISSVALLENSDWTVTEDGVRRDYVNLARTLGGCPENNVGTRFRIISILTTATQLNFVNQICNPGLLPEVADAPIERLLPEGMSPQLAVNGDVAQQIVRHQVGRFLGRAPTAIELADAARHGEACALEVCNAEEFARPSCFAIASSSEMLFH